jgi:DNA polymerase/3'-5' exonuclease PolX
MAMQTPKPRWSAEREHTVAGSLVTRLLPYCEHIVIARALRRNKNTVGTIEILYVSKASKVHADGSRFARDGFLADEQIEHMLCDGMLAKRLNKNGTATGGTLNKLAVHVASRIPVDFFRTREANWFISLVVRSGSVDHNTKLATAARQHDYPLHACDGITRLADDVKLYPQSEREVLELCGLPWRKPAMR